MEAKVRDTATRADQLQLPSLDANAQVTGIASEESGSSDDCGSPTNRVLWELVLHPVEDAVMYGGRRSTADVHGRDPVGCWHWAQSWTVLPGLAWSGQ